MIIAKIDDERFLELVRKAPLIAFQRVEYGFAVAAPGEAYYAPADHPGGGNLPSNFFGQLGGAFLKRMSTPALRTLRPTAKPIPTRELLLFIENTFTTTPEPMEHFSMLPGDNRHLINSECQIVILAIEEDARPDLKDAMRTLKRDEMSDALDLVIQHAESARELCEVGEDKPALIKMYLLQSTAAMKTALEMLLRP